MFGALVILLLLMALAVAFTRLRLNQRADSPYGGLAAVSSSAAPTGSAVPPAAIAAVVPAASAPPAQSAIAPSPRPEATPLPHALAPAAVPPVVAQTTPSPPAAQAPGSAPAATGAPLASTANEADADARHGGTRQIALGKADPGAAPQPAPAALVAAAARAASEPARPARPATSAPQRVAALTPAADDPSPSGRININTASADQLNGIGAGHIGRTIVRHRPYRSLDDLVAHRVLKARDFARIRAAISVD